MTGNQWSFGKGMFLLKGLQAGKDGRLASCSSRRKTYHDLFTIASDFLEVAAEAKTVEDICSKLFDCFDDHTQTLSAEQALMALGFIADQWIEELILIMTWSLEYEGKIITAKARQLFNRIPASLHTKVKPLGDPELDLKLTRTSSKAALETYSLYSTSLEKCEHKETELFESTLKRITNSAATRGGFTCGLPEGRRKERRNVF